MPRRVRCLAVFLGLASAFAPHLAAQCSSQELASSVGTTAGDQLGSAVVLQGDELFVSAPGWPEGSQAYGRVHVFHRVHDAWEPAGTLLPPDLANGTGFGWSLAVQGDVLVVGDLAAFVGDALSGKAFVFEKQAGTWTFVQELAPADAVNFQFFGNAVAIDGDRLVIGAYGDGSNPVFGAGAAYVFERVGGAWQQVAKLKPPGLMSFDGFGNGVAIAGDWLAVGSPGDNSHFGSGGSVHVYHRETGGAWVPTQVLYSTAVLGGDFLGYRLAMQGDTLVASAHLEVLAPVGSAGTGAAYDFERHGSSWDLAQKLTAGDPDDTWGFGAGLSLHGDRLAVGSGIQGDLTDPPGGAQIFDRSNGVWTRVWGVGAPAALGQPASFGGNLAVDGPRLVVGCDRDDALGKDAGQADAFDLGQLHLTFGSGLPGSGGFVPELLGTTCGDSGALDLVLTVKHGLGGAAGALFAGADVGAASFAGGVLYPTAPWRIYPHVLGGAPGVAGDGAWSITGMVPDTLPAMQIVVQALYEDPAASGGWSFSRGLQITLP